MNYEDSGFNEFLSRDISDFGEPEYGEDMVSILTPRVSGSSIVSGISQSNTGKLVINWKTGEMTFSDGARKRVFLGKIEGTDGYGIKIVDANGNTVLSTDGQVQTAGIADDSVTNVKISSVSADKITAGTLSAVTNLGATSIKLDGENKRIIVNDGTNDRILIGYQSGGF